VKYGIINLSFSSQIYTLEELEMIAELSRKHDVIVIADEVYEWLVYRPNKHIKIGMYNFYSREMNARFSETHWSKYLSIASL
jgi:bifunctional pyridoxal-dependent enzyme with beta-cystathionase and maltose regulon repressor activities